jgi:hypothetical protein
MLQLMVLISRVFSVCYLIKIDVTMYNESRFNIYVTCLKFCIM